MTFNHELLTELIEVEDVVGGVCIILIMVIVGIFCMWAGWQVLDDYEKSIRCKWDKVYQKKISIYQNQDDIV